VDITHSSEAAALDTGLSIAAHGAQKLFGWFGGHGINGMSRFFAGLGFWPGNLFILAAGCGEFGGGLLTALGLAGVWQPSTVWLAIGIAVLLALLTVAARRHPAPASQAS
jgi:putative oxidoreductase